MNRTDDRDTTMPRSVYRARRAALGLLLLAVVLTAALVVVAVGLYVSRTPSVT